jgi:hypothetical protein
MIAVWAERFATPEQARYTAPVSQSQVVVAARREARW